VSGSCSQELRARRVGVQRRLLRLGTVGEHGFRAEGERGEDPGREQYAAEVVLRGPLALVDVLITACGVAVTSGVLRDPDRSPPAALHVGVWPRRRE
jgi:hypothetical protein